MNKVLNFSLGLKIRQTNIGIQKIDGITLEIYKIIVSTFFLLDKDSKEKLFQKYFL